MHVVYTVPSFCTFRGLVAFLLMDLVGNLVLAAVDSLACLCLERLLYSDWRTSDCFFIR